MLSAFLAARCCAKLTSLAKTPAACMASNTSGARSRRQLVCNALAVAEMQDTNWKTIKAPNTSNQKGFTLIELISVIVIMGVMVSVAIQKYDFLSDNACMTVLKSGIRELNTRESVTWSKIKLSDTGYSNDADIYNAVDKNIGSEFSWDPSPDTDGGTLHYRSQSIDLTRVPSTQISPGTWE